MKISVVTAVWNRENTITESVTSTQNQSWSNLEHIIQDGASTDGTLEILEKLATSKTSIISAKDGGIYDAINKGISRATGDVIGLMHSDDTFAYTGALADVAKAFQNNQIDGVYGDLEYVSASNNDKVLRHWKSGHYNIGNLRKGWMPPHPTLYLRKSVFEKFGLYDTSYKIAADYDAMLRYLIQGKIRLEYIPKVMVKMKTGGESNRSLGRILLKSKEDYRALRGNNAGGLQTLTMKNLRKINQFRSQ